MEWKKNLGIILLMLGVLLTLDSTSEFKGIISTLLTNIQNYWPIILCLGGLYLICSPSGKK